MKTFKVKGGKTTWIRVNRTYPCPICGKTDWCCINQQQTKAVCMRQLDSTKDSHMGGTIYDLTGREKVDFGELNRNPTQQKMARTNILHKVYSLVIATLGLTEEHKQHLQNERGLTEEQIALRGYASAETQTLKKQIKKFENIGSQSVIETVWEDLFENHGLPKDAWKGIPGFSYSSEKQCPVFNVSKHGILIPNRNSWGQIVGMQIRVNPNDLSYHARVNEEFAGKFRVSIKNNNRELSYVIRDEQSLKIVAEGLVTSKEMTFQNGLSFSVKGGAKYIYVSSADENYGTPASSQPHFSFPDKVLAQARFDQDGNSRVYLMGMVNNIIITEGLLKADIISSLAPNTQLNKLGMVVVVAMAGVSSWKRVADASLKYDFKEFYLALDQDFEETDQVFERLNDLVQYLTYKNSRVSHVLTWETGKGLDDFLLSANEVVEEIKVWSYKA